MSPDVNSLASSRSPSNAGSPILTQQTRTSGPTITAVNEPTVVSENQHSTTRIRRRSSLAATATMNSSAASGSANIPSPNPANVFGSPAPRSPLHTADPNHHRAPSLGQIHQELENEQEAQVNRLLNTIRMQQEQLNALQAQQQSSDAAISSAIDETPSPSRETVPSQTARSLSSSGNHLPPRSPTQRPTTSRHSSRGIPTIGSNTTSPSLRPIASIPGHEEWSMSGTRDDIAFYQAETQTLQRENQMLKQRIRELERQVAERNFQSSAASHPQHQATNGGS